MKVDLGKTLQNLKSIPYLLIPFGIIIAVIAVIFAAANSDLIQNQPNADDLVIQKFEDEIELTIVNAQSEKLKLKVEVAQTSAAIQEGLMNRTFLELDRGMLFVFQNDEQRIFWMKNTYIPLDIIFLNKDKVITTIHKNATPLDETVGKYSSNGAARYAIEVNAGWADLNNVVVGNQVFF